MGFAGRLRLQSSPVRSRLRQTLTLQPDSEVLVHGVFHWVVELVDLGNDYRAMFYWVRVILPQRIRIPKFSDDRLERLPWK